MEFIDTHCHPHFDEFLPDPAGVISRAQEVGVQKMIAVGTTLADSRKAIEFAAMHQSVWAVAGVHPHDAKNFLADSDAPAKLKELLEKPKIVALGEIGLDYFKNYSPRESQQEIFKKQLEIGLGTGLPFVFHVREAWEDFWPIFDSYPVIKGVIHSFSADTEQLEESLKRGLFIGLNGIMTFTKDPIQLEAAKKVPLDKLVLETDAPFLAPKPFRGQTCEPKHVVTTAEFLADLRGEKLEDLAQQTTKNALNLFKLEEV